MFFFRFIHKTIGKQNQIKQKKNKGRGVASSEDFTTDLKFIFSSDREYLVASKNNINKQKPYSPKNNQDLDQIKPIIEVAKKLTISDTTILKGKVTDNKSIEALYINGNSVNFDNNGNFKFAINPKKIKDNIIILEAYDGSGNLTTENVSVELIAKKYKSDQNYYAIVIGNNNYKFLTPLQAAKNDAQEIARILKLNGKVICFGWSSMGLGKNRGFEMTRILLVPHGGSKNDTICTVEIKNG